MGRGRRKIPEKFFGKNRVRLLITVVVYILCAVAVFLPSVQMGGADNLFGRMEQSTFSFFYIFEQGGFSGLIIAQLVIYMIGFIPLLVAFCTNPVKRWGLVTATVFSVLYLLANLGWYALFSSAAVSANVGGFCRPDVFGWIYLVVQLGQIVHMILLARALKK